MKPNYQLKPGMYALGIEQLHDHQLKPIQSLMNGDDTVVIAATDSSKGMRARHENFPGGARRTSGSLAHYKVEPWIKRACNLIWNRLKLE